MAYSQERIDRALDSIAVEIAAARKDEGLELTPPRGALSRAADLVGCAFDTVKGWWGKLSEEEIREKVENARGARERARIQAANVVVSVIEEIKTKIGSMNGNELATCLNALRFVADGERPATDLLDLIDLRMNGKPQAEAEKIEPAAEASEMPEITIPDDLPGSIH